jgi:coenzyme F420-0:L-glutamate ligase/coenzyme F420-1:gamma-L-glutamate ligase
LIELTRSYTVVAIDGFPLVELGDDIGELIVASLTRNGMILQDGDIVAISQKIVSKAEGRLVNLEQVTPSKQTEELAKVTQKDPRLVELVLRESKRVAGVAEHALVVETSTGTICLNAGIDKSNVSGKDTYSLLPKDPDSSAQRIRSKLHELTKKTVGVIICDTYSRPFRNGIVEFAIGLAGVKPFKDYRGTRDLFGNELRWKLVAVADEIAAAAELVMGQGTEATPVAIVKGLTTIDLTNGPESSDLIMPTSRDLYRGAI